MANVDERRDVTSHTEPEMGTYLQSRADATQGVARAPQGRDMPGPGMSAEHQMPSREMNESSASPAQVKGDMPRPNMV